MDDRKKIDFKQHTLPKVSKWYLWRIIVYVVLLIIVGGFMYYLYQRESVKKAPPKSTPNEIHDVEIELSD